MDGRFLVVCKGCGSTVVVQTQLQDGFDIEEATIDVLEQVECEKCGEEKMCACLVKNETVH
jgi:hypothetical protein